MRIASLCFCPGLCDFIVLLFFSLMVFAVKQSTAVSAFSSVWDVFLFEFLFVFMIIAIF